MEQLFRSTELESRFPLNMNVLSRGKVPKVMSLKDVLREWLDHRREVLQRKSQHRLDEIARRLEILSGYLIAFLNIDAVIKSFTNAAFVQFIWHVINHYCKTFFSKGINN